MLFLIVYEADPYIWTKSTNYTGYPNKAVVAGKDDGNDVWVGRAKHDGQWTPAKVIHNKKVAYVPYGGKEHVKNEYEVNYIEMFCFCFCSFELMFTFIQKME